MLALSLQPFFHPDAAPGSGGGSAAGQQGSGGGTPAGGQGSGQGGTGTGTPAPLALSDDAMVIPPGSTTAVRYADYIKNNYVPTTVHTQWDALRQRGEAALIERARQLDERQAALNGGGASRRTQEPPDPLADIEQLTVVDGKSLAGLYRHLDSQGLGPVRQAMQQMQETIKKMGERLDGTVRTTGALANQRTEAQFTARVDAALRALPAFSEIKIPEAAELRELALDIWGSHEPNAELEAGFNGLLSARIDKLRKVFREMDRVESKQRLEVHRLPPQGGRVTPTGQAPRLENTKEIASRFFPQSANT